FQDRLAQRFALFLGEQACEILLAILQKVGCLIEDFCALGRRNRGPFLECALGGIDCPIDIFLSGGSGAIDELTRGRVPNLGRPAIRRVSLFSANDKFCHSCCQSRLKPATTYWPKHWASVHYDVATTTPF